MRDDEVAYGDFGCTGAGKRPEIAGGARKSAAAFRIGRKGTVKAKRGKAVETWKPGGRGRAEHPFLAVKRSIGFCKAVCKGLRKNGDRLFASASIPMCARAGRLGRRHA